MTRRLARRLLRPSCILLGAAALLASVAVPASVVPASQPAPQPAPRGTTDHFRPGYYYEAAYTYADTAYTGFQASLVVGHPGDVKGKKHQHSLGQIAVGQRRDRSYLEAGWTQESTGGRPRLFVFWRPASGADTCYDFGCGFHRRGHGMRPGHAVEPGSVLTVGYQHVGRKWWLFVDGKRSGFYPDRLWKGRRFTGSDFAQVFGEVYVKKGQRVCADMGNGQYPSSGLATTITAAWIGGPAASLTPDPRNTTDGYQLSQTAPDTIAYGGPGYC